MVACFGHRHEAKLSRRGGLKMPNAASAIVTAAKPIRATFLLAQA
jgi:hypothetical protein